MSQPDTALSHEVRFRVPLPIVIPVGALLLIGVTAFGMSRIFLSVPKEISVVIAVAIGANILIACSIIALRPDTARTSWGELAIVALYPLIIGIVIAQLGLGTGHSADEGGTTEGAPAAAGAAGLTAANVQFDTDTLELNAGQEASIPFVNEDTQEHNLAIYEDESTDKEIFVGDLIPGGQETTYTFAAPEKGEYYFQCDVHPGMNGTLTVK